MNIKLFTPPTQRGERGQSLVELAISLTFIILLLAGAVDFGNAFFSYVALRDAAQEGALYGSMNPADIFGVETRVRSASTNPIDLYDTSVQVNVTIVGSACEGGGVQVDVIYDYPISMPFMTAITGPTITLRARVTDTILQPPC
jgi:Flp pilus assembly protein TadG